MWWRRGEPRDGPGPLLLPEGRSGARVSAAAGTACPLGAGAVVDFGGFGLGGRRRCAPSSRGIHSVTFHCKVTKAALGVRAATSSEAGSGRPSVIVFVLKHTRMLCELVMSSDCGALKSLHERLGPPISPRNELSPSLASCVLQLRYEHVPYRKAHEIVGLQSYAQKNCKSPGEKDQGRSSMRGGMGPAFLCCCFSPLL